jgi:hypothetical protein
LKSSSRSVSASNKAQSAYRRPRPFAAERVFPPPDSLSVVLACVSFCCKQISARKTQSAISLGKFDKETWQEKARKMRGKESKENGAANFFPTPVKIFFLANSTPRHRGRRRGPRIKSAGSCLPAQGRIYSAIFFIAPRRAETALDE